MGIIRCKEAKNRNITTAKIAPINLPVFSDFVLPSLTVFSNSLPKLTPLLIDHSDYTSL